MRPWQLSLACSSGSCEVTYKGMVIVVLCTMWPLVQLVFVLIDIRMLPKARVVYCSATGVSHVKNMVCTVYIFNG